MRLRPCAEKLLSKHGAVPQSKPEGRRRSHPQRGADVPRAELKSHRRPHAGVIELCKERVKIRRRGLHLMNRTVSQTARVLGADAQQVKAWAWRFKEHLSSQANPPKGCPRVFTELGRTGPYARLHALANRSRIS